MAEEDRDPKVSQAYRALEREEPPRALDEAILAAARREVGARPAPLVAPVGRRRWYFPVAAAAVIVLSATVALRIWYEPPEMDGASPEPAPPAGQKRADEPPAARDELRAKTQPGGSQRGVVSGVEPLKDASPPLKEPPRIPESKVEAPAAAPEPKREQGAPRSPESAVTGRLSKESAARPMMQQRAAPEPAEERTRSATVEESPERWLERIAELRRQGRDDEADRQLAEFRKRHPDHKVPEAVLRR